MTKLVNRAKMSTATTGTGTITLGSAEAGYQSFAAAGVVDGDVVRYVIEDGTAFEIGTGTFGSAGGTLTRTVSESSNAGSPLVLTGNAVVYVSATAADIPPVLELYAENPSSPTAPSATGTNAVAIGNSPVSAGTNSMSLGRSFASGADSFAAAIANNTSTYGATGANSVAIGKQARATTFQAVCISNTSTASSQNAAVLGGSFNTASGNSSVVLGGGSNVANSERSVAYGHHGNTNGILGKVAHGIGPSRQNGMYGLAIDTADATPKQLVTDFFFAGNATNQIILPNNSAYSFSGTIIARQQASAGSEYAAWEIKGAILRDGTAATTVLGNGIKNSLYASAGAAAWDISLTADTTNGGLAITVTGAAATNIRWVATVNTSEVTY